MHPFIKVTALLLAMVATVIVAAPATATTPPPDYGSRVQCRYRADGPGPAHEWELRRFVVEPPVMHTNMDQQTVGWRFVVQRSLNGEYGPWKVTYRSAIQKRTATASHAEPFDTKSVDVAVPDVENPRDVHYQVTLKMFRYRSDGSVKSSISYQMPLLKWYLNGNYYGDEERFCQANFYEGP